MAEFVLEQYKVRIMNFINESTIVAYEKTLKYANFINQDLNIVMFVPAVFKDGDCVVLEKPNINNFKSDPFCSTGNCEAYREELKEFKEAEERVLFKGFEVRESDFERILIHDKQNKAVGTFINNKFHFFPAFKTIENLIPLKLELTETAKNLLK